MQHRIHQFNVSNCLAEVSVIYSRLFGRDEMARSCLRDAVGWRQAGWVLRHNNTYMYGIAGIIPSNIQGSLHDGHDASNNQPARANQ